VRALQLATATAPPTVHDAKPAAAQLLRGQPASPAPERERIYGVQLGAFGSEASADREWRRLQGRFGAQLGGLSPRIVAAGNTGQLYRLQAPAAGEAQARALCDSLKERSQPCVPVVPH
jgi:cell division protein FtsN